ncbi:hypothetical protein G5V59_20620 [Nocardioides sp. W3-2-3]|uniref:hypothetical protein n=1 Tax=Nocardioides convexus TaxID=2712224 RepID=UPI002418231B|nr:hypothetical protein [Nocardioides convexus]NHA01423.1 hypothetical protein [Nocardioides convexus]
MAKKPKAWIHVGMPGAGDVVEPALAHHHGALVETRRRVGRAHARGEASARRSR